jgi:hypothetical protein
MENNFIKKFKALFADYNNHRKELSNYENPLNWLEKYFLEIAIDRDLAKIKDSIFLLKDTDKSLLTVFNLYNLIIVKKKTDYKTIETVRMSHIEILNFHNLMVKQLELKRSKLVIHRENRNNKVYFYDNPMKSYILKREEPERFKIIYFLAKAKNAKSLNQISEYLEGKKPESIAKEIRTINKLFKKNCNTQKDLIPIKTLETSSRTYVINREEFLIDVD